MAGDWLLTWPTPVIRCHIGRWMGDEIVSTGDAVNLALMLVTGTLLYVIVTVAFSQILDVLPPSFILSALGSGGRM